MATQESDIEVFFDVLASTFLLMAAGFILPASGWLDKEVVGQGLSAVVGRFVLPVLLFITPAIAAPLTEQAIPANAQATN